jgi:hypothetical protein
MSCPTSATDFVAWHRPSPRKPWTAVATASTWGSAWDVLLRDFRGGEKCVLATGVHPESPLGGGRKDRGRAKQKARQGDLFG